MNIEQLRNQLPEYANDIKLNLSSIITPDGAPDLTQKQIYAIALASAYATKNLSRLPPFLKKPRSI